MIQQASELQMEEFGDMALVLKGIARVDTVNSQTTQGYPSFPGAFAWFAFNYCYGAMK
jgi:hypothetical protein